MGRSLEDGVLVILKDLEPVADIVGMVFPDFPSNAEVGAKEGGAQFCNQLLAGIERCLTRSLPAAKRAIYNPHHGETGPALSPKKGA